MARPESSFEGKTLIVTATYNEIENLPGLVEEIHRYMPQADLLIVDDDSPDGTGRWALQQADKDPRITTIVRQGKQGLGSAIVCAMRHAIDSSYHYLINIDADFSHPPDVLPRLVRAMDEDGGQDVVIGSRYIAGGGVSGWPLRRQLMSRCVNFYARNLLRLPVRDCSGGYRCFRVTKLTEIDFDTILATGYAFHEEILFHLRCAGARFGETPIIFTDRCFGKSKLNLREALAALRVILQLGLFGGRKKRTTASDRDACQSEA
jgi:dolichol-phosphate mannosyltransferase